MQNKQHHTTAVIACGSLTYELKVLAEDAPHVTCVFMDQNYHRTPEKLTGALQEAIDEVAKNTSVERIILGYGMCSNGTVGLKAPSQGLLIPAVHDCIGLYLGSNRKYEQVFKAYPGTYFLTPSWIELRKDPLGLMHNEYTQRVGKEDAEWAMKEEIKNYRYIGYVQQPESDKAAYEETAKENAAYFDKQYVKFEGRNDFFKQILFGPYDDKAFIYIEPGNIVKQKHFFKKIGGLL